MLVCVEGNVASGKSTLLESLRAGGATVVCEPLAAWAPFLSKSGDRSLFQCVALAWYVIVARKYMDSDEVVYVERSPASCELVFAPDVSFASPPLQQCHARLLSLLRQIFRPSLYVVLMTSPGVCFDRLSARCAAGDGHLSLPDLQRFHARHWQLVWDLRLSGALCALI